MILENNQIWITVSELVEYGVSDSYLKIALRRNRDGETSSWHNIPDPEDNRKKLIQYATIPATTIDKYNMPDEEYLIGEYNRDNRRHVIASLKTMMNEERDHGDVKYFESVSVNRNQAFDLSVCAAWMRILTRFRGKTQVRSLNLPGIETKEDLTQTILKIIEETRPYGLNNVSSIQVLKRYMTRWKKASGEDQLLSLLHKHRKIRGKRAGNQAARKITTDVEQVLLSLWLNMESDVKMSELQIYEHYNQAIVSSSHSSSSSLVSMDTGEVFTDLPSISLSSVRSFLNRPHVKALGKHRHGSKHYRDRIRPYIIGAKPNFSFSMSSSDGFVVPFWLKVQMKDKKGQTYWKNTWKRPVCYAFFDVHSGAIIGAAIGGEESYELLKRAFIDMVIRQGLKIPMANQMDNFNKFFDKALSQFSEAEFCKPYNPQSKYAERLIREMKMDVMSMFPGYVGRHSLRNENNKRNPDKGHPDNADVCYSWDEFHDLLEQWIDRYNSKRDRVQKLNNVNPETLVLEDLQRIGSVFGDRIKTKIDRGTVIITRGGIDYKYRVPDLYNTLQLLENGNRIRARILPDHPEKGIWIYNYDTSDNPEMDRLICHCYAEFGTQRAKAEQKDADKENLIKQMQWLGKFESEVEKAAANVPRTLVPAEAEGMAGAGYTSKPAMKQAAEEEEREHLTATINKPRINPRWI